jgi:hypothetical protein
MDDRGGRENLESMTWAELLTVGVTRAAILQPYLAKMDLPRSIIIRVTVPVTELKLPMNAE